jgi:hypothetical protein
MFNHITPSPLFLVMEHLGRGREKMWQGDRPMLVGFLKAKK